MVAVCCFPQGSALPRRGLRYVPPSGTSNALPCALSSERACPSLPRHERMGAAGQTSSRALWFQRSRAGRSIRECCFRALLLLPRAASGRRVSPCGLASVHRPGCERTRRVVVCGMGCRLAKRETSRNSETQIFCVMNIWRTGRQKKKTRLWAGGGVNRIDASMCALCRTMHATA